MTSSQLTPGLSHSENTRSPDLAAPLPFVSVIVPCRNEEKHIARCLDSIIASDYPRERIEILILDGMSEDRTKEMIAGHVQHFSQVSLLANPSRSIPAAMNLGIRSARGEIVVKMDAHSTYPVDYISKSVRFLQEFGAECVGGVFKIRPGRNTTIANAIACALSHRFGSGNAYAKVGCTEPRCADAVSFGCFRKAVFAQVGGWNEDLAGSSDMDFNVRLKKAGGKILLVPSIMVDYYADADLRSLWRHNFADGVWATYVMKFKSRAWSWRHWIPMTFVASIIGTAVLGAFLPAFWWLLGTIVGVYLFSSLAASAQLALRERTPSLLVLLPVTFGVRHLSHGLGALYGLLLVLAPGKRWKGRRSSEA